MSLRAVSWKGAVRQPPEQTAATHLQVLPLQHRKEPNPEDLQGRSRAALISQPCSSKSRQAHTDERPPWLLWGGKGAGHCHPHRGRGLMGVNWPLPATSCLSREGSQASFGERETVLRGWDGMGWDRTGPGEGSNPVRIPLPPAPQLRRGPAPRVPDPAHHGPRDPAQLAALPPGARRHEAAQRPHPSGHAPPARALRPAAPRRAVRTTRVRACAVSLATPAGKQPCSGSGPPTGCSTVGLHLHWSWPRAPGAIILRYSCLKEFMPAPVSRLEHVNGLASCS